MRGWPPTKAQLVRLLVECPGELGQSAKEMKFNFVKVCSAHMHTRHYRMSEVPLASLSW